MPPLRAKIETYDQPLRTLLAVAGGIYILAGLAGWLSGMMLVLGAIACGVAVWLFLYPSTIARQMERGDYLAHWEYTYADREEAHRLAAKAKEWEAIPTPMFFATAGFLAMTPLGLPVAGKYLNGWMALLLFVSGLLGLAIVWAFAKNRGARYPDRVVEYAVISLTHMYWRRRLVPFCPLEESKPMRLKRVGRRVFFIGVSEFRHSEGPEYREFWALVPRGQEREAERIMLMIRKHAADSAEQLPAAESST